MPSPVRLFLKVLTSFAFAGSVYWVISTVKTDPFSVEPEPIVAVITSLIALVIAMYEKNKSDETPSAPPQNNTMMVEGNGNTALQNVHDSPINIVTQNHSGSGDNVAGGRIQK
jgi:hypothetical protein